MTKRKNNKKYKSNKIIILLSIVFAAILVAAAIIAYFIFAQNTEDISADNLQNSSQSSLSETISTETNFSEANSSEPTSAEVTEASIYTSYKPYKAVESETDKEASLATVFGTAYNQYGGELKLNADKTFSLYVGISNSDDSEGTFTLENDKIKATFNSGDEKEFTIIQEDGTTVIIVPMGLYNVYFKP